MKHVGNFDFYSVSQLAFDKRGDERRDTVGQEQEQTVSFHFIVNQSPVTPRIKDPRSSRVILYYALTFTFDVVHFLRLRPNSYLLFSQIQLISTTDF